MSKNTKVESNNSKNSTVKGSKYFGSREDMVAEIKHFLEVGRFRSFGYDFPLEFFDESFKPLYENFLNFITGGGFLEWYYGKLHDNDSNPEYSRIELKLEGNPSDVSHVDWKLEFSLGSKRDYYDEVLVVRTPNKYDYLIRDTFWLNRGAVIELMQRAGRMDYKTYHEKLTPLDKYLLAHYMKSVNESGVSYKSTAIKLDSITSFVEELKRKYQIDEAALSSLVDDMNGMGLPMDEVADSNANTDASNSYVSKVYWTDNNDEKKDSQAHNDVDSPSTSLDNSRNKGKRLNKCDVILVDLNMKLPARAYFRIENVNGLNFLHVVDGVHHKVAKFIIDLHEDILIDQDANEVCSIMDIADYLINNFFEAK